MNIQLFLAGEEVELTQNISFPLNKTFSNLNNPTDIIVDYSKSINIPMSAKNNRIFANAYRLDRAIVGGGDENLGLYLDPSKKIPMKLIYNGSLVMDGYAKYVSASYSISNKYYTINLYGQLGWVFQELMKVVPSESLLGDKDPKYILTEPSFSTKYYFNRSFASQSFNRDNNYVWTPERGTTSFGSLLDVYGVAPTYRGLYNDFDSKKIQISYNEIVDISKYLDEKWNDTLIDQGFEDSTTRKEKIEAFNSQELVGDGFPDYQMNQYASNKLKPYVYINQLFRMFSSKCKELTGFTMDYDTNWFNVNNPYWAKMVYMFDFLDSNKTKFSETSPMFDPTQTDIISEKWVNGVECGGDWATMETITNIIDANTSVLAPFEITFGCSDTISNIPQYVNLTKLQLMPETAIMFKMSVYRYTNSNKTEVSPAGSFDFWTSGNGGTNGLESEKYTQENFIPIISKYENVNSSSRKSEAYYTVKTKNVIIGELPYGGYMEITASYYNGVGVVGNGGYTVPGIFIFDGQLRWTGTGGPSQGGNAQVNISGPVGCHPDMRNGTGQLTQFSTTVWSVKVGNINRYVNWKTETSVSLSTIYKKETPIFNILLEYTKMFNLKWDIDPIDKKISIKTIYSYFKDKNILDWNDKVDRSKEFKIEPLIYDTKNLKMNYKDVDGNHYSDYRDDYGVNIGEKVINTGYEFNLEDKDLFKDISPSSCSSKTFVPFLSFVEWDFDTLTPQQYPIPLIDCEDEDEKSSISINNWYLRGDNSDLVTAIIDETATMIVNDVQCYISDTQWREISEASMPVFTTAAKWTGETFYDNVSTYGCFFNTPKVDYTSEQLFQNTLNSNIYEYCWKDWMEESTNIQNKKVTAYINLTPTDYSDFKFSDLVCIDNQLFRVNKIMDYNLNNTGSTKCELIQVHNPDKLTSTIFPKYGVVVRVGNKYYMGNNGVITVKGPSTTQTATITVYVYGRFSSTMIGFTGMRPSLTTNTGTQYNYYTTTYAFSNLSGKRQYTYMTVGGVSNTTTICFDFLGD